MAGLQSELKKLAQNPCLNGESPLQLPTHCIFGQVFKFQNVFIEMWYLDSGWLLCCFCLKEHLSVTLLCLWKPVGEATHNATVGLDKHQGDCIASRHSSSRRQESGSAPEISFIFFSSLLEKVEGDSSQEKYSHTEEDRGVDIF